MNDTLRNIESRLEALEKGQERILELLLVLQTQKTTRAIKEADMRKDKSVALRRLRVLTVEKIFHKVMSTNYSKRLYGYRFPRAIMEDITKPVRQAMVYSVLVNQCSLRKCFKPVAGEQGRSPADIAKEAIEDSNLIVVRIADTVWGPANTLIVVSPAEAVQSIKNPTKIPSAWKGWTCAERMGITNSAVGPLPPPHDPSGTRRWEGFREESIHEVQGRGDTLEDLDGDTGSELEIDQEDEDIPAGDGPAWTEDRETGGDPFGDIEAQVAPKEKPSVVFDKDAFASYEEPSKKTVKIKFNIGGGKS